MDNGKRIVLERPDAGITVIIAEPHGKPLSQSGIAKAIGETERRVGPCVRLSDTTQAELPGKRFRNSWRNDGTGKVRVDMPLARTQRLDEIRKERNELLKAADGPTAREMEQKGPNLQQWIDYKQALRDIPSSVNLSTIKTAVALEAFNPAWPSKPE